MDYYERELSSIDFTGEYAATMCFASGGQKTKTLNVNQESAAAVISKLVEVFGIDVLIEAAKPKKDRRACWGYFSATDADE